MKRIQPDLWQTSPEHPFSGALATHAYLLTRREGNVLFYSTGNAQDYQHIRELGRITHHFTRIALE